MRIAFFIYHLGNGGAERVMSTLVNYCADNGYEVDLLVFSNKKPFYKLHSSVNLVVCEQPKHSNSILNVLARLRFIIRYLKKQRPVLLVSFMTETNIIATMAGRFLRIPVVISERTNPDKHPVGKTISRLRNFLYRFVSVLVVQTEKVKKHYTSLLREEKIVVIPNPIIMDDFLPAIAISDKPRSILNIGRLSFEKGQDILLEAFAGSLGPSLGWHLNIIGDGVWNGFLKEKIASLKMESHISMLGKQSDVHSLMDSNSIYVLSSRYEGFPNALMEAMAMKMACISTACESGPSEMITDHVSGLLVETESIESLRHAIDKLIVDEGLRRTLSDNARSAVMKYDHRKVMKTWVDLFEKSVTTKKLSTIK